LMTQRLVENWQSTFLKIIQQPIHSTLLKEAALQERLGDWTKTLTSVVIETNKSMGWQASAKGHYLQMLPVPRNEYLALDIMAFPDGKKRWRFPIAILELENSKDDDRIAYSLWKVMCVRADLRIVFCYRRSADEGSRLISFLRDEVIYAMGLINRINLEGKTLLVVGSRDSSATFPYGFFKWWHLDTNTGTSHLL
jgi:hypothetical protein